MPFYYFIVSSNLLTFRSVSRPALVQSRVRHSRPLQHQCPAETDSQTHAVRVKYDAILLFYCCIEPPCNDYRPWRHDTPRSHWFNHRRYSCFRQEEQYQETSLIGCKPVSCPVLAQSHVLHSWPLYGSSISASSRTADFYCLIVEPTPFASEPMSFYRFFKPP